MVLFLPVLLSETEWIILKSVRLRVLDNVVIALLAAVLFVVMVAIYYLLRKVTYNRTVNWCVNGLLVVFFTGVYFLGVEISKCIAFYSGWDVSCLAGTVYNLSAGTPIGGEVYYSMYPHNVPIVYFMQKAYNWAKNNSEYFYNAEFIWIQMNNAFISIAGFASYMAVKRLTKQIFPIIVVLGLLTELVRLLKNMKVLWKEFLMKCAVIVICV